MARRVLVTLCVLGALLSVLMWHVPQHAVAAAKPDIIVVMVDDLGAIDNRILERLPNIRSLFLKNGLQFNHAYSETPLCCPGRASFLTGQHTRRSGVVVNDARLLDPSHTIATTLHDAGYFTMMVGKYLNGAAQLSDHTPPGWDQVAMLNDWSTNHSSDWWIQDQPVVGGYFDRFIDVQASTWLEQAPANKPVFMWVAPHAPHKSADKSQDWEPDIEPQYTSDPRCAGISPWKPPNYDFGAQPAGYPLDDICRSLLTVDDMVGSLQGIAQQEGRQPVWMFTSDNGMAWGADGYLLKNVPQADQLPLYFSGPGVVEGQTNVLVSNIDFSPTLAELAGTSMPYADGRPFVHVLEGTGEGRKSMLEDHPVGGPTGEGDVATGPWWAVRTPKWHLVVWNGIHLYDVVNDPWEETDVAADHPDVVDQLEHMYNRPIPTPSPSGSPLPSPTESPPPTGTPSPTLTPEPTPTSEPSATGETPGDSPIPASPSSSLASASPRPAKHATAVPSPTPALASPATDTTGGATPAVAAWLVIVAFAVIAGAILGRHIRPRTAPSK